MTERLSRVKRINEQQQAASKQKRHAKAKLLDKNELPSQEHMSANAEMAAASALAGEGFPSRSQRQAQEAAKLAAGQPEASKTEASKPEEFPGVETVEAFLSQKELEADAPMPARTQLFPSHRIKWTKWFFNVLLVIFIILTLWLLWWGFHDSPWSIKRNR